jgi:hypothetical protein
LRTTSSKLKHSSEVSCYFFFFLILLFFFEVVWGCCLVFLFLWFKSPVPGGGVCVYMGHIVMSGCGLVAVILLLFSWSLFITLFSLAILFEDWLFSVWCCWFCHLLLIRLFLFNLHPFSPLGHHQECGSSASSTQVCFVHAQKALLRSLLSLLRHAIC